MHALREGVGQFTPVLALYDPFGVDVPLNVDITHSLREGVLFSVYEVLLNVKTSNSD